MSAPDSGAKSTESADVPYPPANADDQSDDQSDDQRVTADGTPDGPIGPTGPPGASPGASRPEVSERPVGAGALAGRGAGSRAAGELSAELLGVERLGERATLVQFSTAFCQPCRAARHTLGEVSAMVEGVAHVEIDAESNLELVRALGVTGTPTVLVLDGAGRIVRRASGAPRRADVIAALGAAVG